MNSLCVRDATPEHLPTLNTLKNAPGVHFDRLRDAEAGLVRYLVCESEREILGFCLLVFTRPPNWSDADDHEHLPQLVDLQIAPRFRSRGYGALFLQQIARMVKKSGGRQLFTAVDPIENPRAHVFYKRLGYRDVQPEPHRIRWHFTDSDGEFHSGEQWTQHLVLNLEAE